MRLIPLFICLATLNCVSQTCNYLSYESFDYQPNMPLHGAQGGNGWGGPWEVQNGNTSVPGFQISAGTPLNYSDLTTQGNYASGGNAYLTAGRALNTQPGGPFDDWLNTNNEIGKYGKTIWISALLRKSADNSEQVALYFHNSNINWCSGCTSQKIGIGYFGNDSNVNGQKRWSLFVNGLSYTSDVVVVPNQTVLLVVKVEFDGLNALSLYANPINLGVPPQQAPNLYIQTAQSVAFRNVALYPGNSPGAGSVDEIRIGKSFECVTPNPLVMVNQGPIADFTANPVSGTAPLPITFDAGLSYDPDGSIVSYEWNFGDGAPKETGSIVTHTYVNTGQFNVTLTVTDNNGVQQTHSKTVTVLNASGSFSCLANVTLDQPATCTENIGKITLGGSGIQTITLLNASGGMAPPGQSLNVFDHLAPGPYTMITAGTNGCRDTFHLHIPVDSSTCSGWAPDTCGMKIGVGMEGFAYYSSGRAFKDYFKSADQWITYDPSNTVQGWNTGDQQYIPRDANGYPTQIPFPTPNGTRALRGIISANGFIPVGVPMRLLYDGSGMLTMQGTVTVVQANPGQIDFSATDAGNIWFHLSQSDSTNPVRNIRIVAFSDLSTYETQPFRENFLEKAGKFNALRFMDWMATNGNRNIQWSNRTKPGYFSQAVNPNGGVAYEYIIQLANQLHKDIWICIPHQADDDYIAQMAAMFRDQLNPGIHVYLEYSNEVWNWIFDQAHWVSDNGPQNISYPRRYVERATHAFRIWTAAWGDQKTRLKRVLGTQAGYDWITAEIMAHARPEDYDYISPSWYVGLDHGDSGIPNLVALGANATADDVLDNAHQVFLEQIPRWKMVYNTAKLYGKKVVNYEGGQHFTNFTEPAYLPAMYDAQVHPRIYDLYQEMLDSLRRFGSEMPFAFVLTGPWQSKYGSWGHLFDDDDPAPWTDRPKFQVLLDNICQTVSATHTYGNENIQTPVLYPNPAQDELILEMPVQCRNLQNSVIFSDLSGRIVQRVVFDGPGISIPLKLNAGLYLVQIQDETGLLHWVKKIVVAEK
jgi:PKD repeat protein